MMLKCKKEFVKDEILDGKWYPSNNNECWTYHYSQWNQASSKHNNKDHINITIVSNKRNTDETEYKYLIWLPGYYSNMR